MLRRNSLFLGGMAIAGLGFVVAFTTSKPVGITIATVGGLMMALFKYGNPGT